MLVLVSVLEACQCWRHVSVSIGVSVGGMSVLEACQC